MLIAVLFACASEPVAAPEPITPSVSVPTPPEPAAPVAAPAAAPAGRVFLIEPAEGAQVKSPVHLKFGVEGMTVAPAGTPDPLSGHHHILIDTAAIPAGTIVPKDDHHQHFGKGQTETDLELTPGEHSLTLQFADGNHISYGEAWSATVKVTVVP